MTHVIILPFVLPLLTGALLMLLTEHSTARRVVACVSTLAGLAVAIMLMQQSAAGQTQYQLGAWPWPFGITLWLDRMSALMLLLSAGIAVVALLPGVGYDDARNRYALALAQFQIAGINGAFLAGDLFNLFVCFEILLISSYALMVHGHHRAPRSGLIYTVLNLTGSAVFLIGIGLLYGATGSLNLVDLAGGLQRLGPDVTAMATTGAWLVALVFALKAALLPIGFWLPGAYGVSGPMAITLFALLTKVGVYALARVFAPWFATEHTALATIGELLRGLALLSIVGGALLALASQTLRQLAGALVIASVATALLALSTGGAPALSATLFYVVHSTLAAAAIFLVSAYLARLRGTAEDRLDVSPAISSRGPAMLLFLGIAIVVSGLPPLSGFLGKLSVLQVVSVSPGAAWSVGLLLTGSLITLLAVTRAGNAVFLRAPVTAATVPPAHGATAIGLAAVVMLGLSILMTLGAGPLRAWTDAAAVESSQLPAPRGGKE
jgi:multicomponent K+:H+ antiporter subunit D